MKSDQENEFEKQGVTFKIITDDMALQVTDFMWKNFFPNESTSRSLASIKEGISIAVVTALIMKMGRS